MTNEPIITSVTERGRGLLRGGGYGCGNPHIGPCVSWETFAKATEGWLDEMHGTDQARERGERMAANMLLGREFVVLGLRCRVTGLDWPDGEPPAWAWDAIKAQADKP